MTVNGYTIDIDATLEDFLTGSISGLESGSFEENINGDGKLSLSWRSMDGGGLPQGTRVTVTRPGDEVGLGFYLQDNYAPSANGDGTYTWSPTFISDDSKLKGIVIYRNVDLQVGGWIGGQGSTRTVRIYTWPYMGNAATLVNYLSQFMPSGSGIVLGSEYENRGISVSFDQDNIVSACQKIADALGTNSTIEGGSICIGTHSAVATGERYNRFIVMGGTRNMGKLRMSESDTYAAVTLRLQLDETKYPNSVMPAESSSETGVGKMTKFLIFDDIYPKMELTVGGVRIRTCYLYDEEGRQMVDGNNNPLTYNKYYITLSLGANPYNFNKSTVIQGRTLGIVFQSGLLAGREFDLAYYDDEGGTQTIPVEKEEDDVSQAGFQPLNGEYRICLVADGDTLLPNASLAPAVGDKVTLVGVALDMKYYTEAQERLEKAAQYYVGLYSSDAPTEVSFNSEKQVPDFLTEIPAAPSPGTRYNSPRRSSGNGLGDDHGSYIVTSVTTDIMSGTQQIHYGTFEPKGLLSGVANLLETASVRGGGAYVGSDDDEFIRHTGAMSLDQFKTLYEIYGHLGMKTVNNRFSNVDEAMEALRSSFNDVQQQSDRKFDIWFLENAPYPQKDDATAANFPASDWDTDDEKEIHVQDIAYDVSRPSDSDGGRTWRWVSEEDGNGNIIYYWERITDGDTLAALEMLSDMSADNVLTPAEKLVARRDWSAIVAEFAALIQRAATAEVDATAYSEAYYALRAYLHSPTVYVETDQYLLQALGMIRNGEVTDAYTLLISNNITTGTESLAAYISDGDDDDLAAAVTALEADLHSQQKGDAAIINSSGNTVINGQTWKALWDGYYSERTALLSALSGKALGELDDMAADNVLTDIEKLAIIREYERIKEETRELLQQASAAGLDDDSGSTQEAYREAYSLLYSYLDDKTSGYTFTDDLTNHSDPVMLYNGETTAINGTTFTSLWSGYYNAAASLRAAIRSAGQRVFVGATAPNPPYKVGDLWVKTSDDKYKLMICITASTKGQPNDAHWTEHEVYKDARSLLASLADYVFAHYESSMPVTVTLGATCSITGNVQGVDNTLALLYHFLGDCEFTISKASSLPGSGSLYDLCCIPVSFNIPGSQEVLTGGCKISMWNGSGWEFLQESTSALIQNLGNKINAVVFGSSAAATEAAGLSIGQRFAKMFATAQVWDPDANNGQGGYVTLTQALFGLSIEKDQNTGKYYSTAQLRADKIDFTAGTFTIGADHISFGGKTVSMNANESLTFSGGSIVFNSSTSIDLNAAQINLNADKINWKKGSNDGTQNGFSGDIIPGGSGSGYDPETDSKFYVDQNGNVTMNNLTANNGHFNGELKTLNGRIVVDETEFDNEGYTWYGIAGGIYNNVTYRDVLAFGLRDYGSNNLVGHLTLRGRGTYGGVFEVVTGDQNGNKSTLKMGANNNHAGVEIDGVAGSLKLNNSSSTTKVSLEGNTGNGSFDGKGTFGGTVKAEAFISGLLNVTSGGSYNVGDSIEKILVSHSGDVTLNLPTPPSTEAGRTLFLQKRNGGNLTISHSSLNITADQSWGMFMLVWNGSSWQY